MSITYVWIFDYFCQNVESVKINANFILKIINILNFFPDATMLDSIDCYFISFKKNPVKLFLGISFLSFLFVCKIQRDFIKFQLFIARVFQVIHLSTMSQWFRKEFVEIWLEELIDISINQARDVFYK